MAICTLYASKVCRFQVFYVGLPGANCSIFGCHTSRNKKYQGISIFKVPVVKDESNTSWRGRLIHVITKDRVINASLRKQSMSVTCTYAKNITLLINLFNVSIIISFLLFYACNCPNLMSSVFTSQPNAAILGQ